MTSFQFMIVLVCCNIHDSSFFFAFQLVSNCNLSKKFDIPRPKKSWNAFIFFKVCTKGVEFLLPVFFPEKNAWHWRWSPNICIWVVVWLFSPEGHHWPQKLLMVFLAAAFRVNWANMQNNKSWTFQQSITQIKSSRP